MNRYSRGDVVEVLTQDEIYATLDSNGALDGLPFMPEMTRFCGRRYRVARRADRTCVEGVGEKLMDAAVFLEDLRCDGSAHDGCQRNCLIFWKERWVRSVDEAAPLAAERHGNAQVVPRYPVKAGDKYYCQSTELARATKPGYQRDVLAMLLDDLRHGEVSYLRVAWILLRVVTNKIRRAIGLPQLGQVAGPGGQQSRGDLRLKAGDLVEIRPLSEILATLDREGKNNGLAFDLEMPLYKGVYEVEGPIERIIFEPTGKMRTLTHTVTLKGLACQGICQRNCPRANTIYWRESWLRKLPQGKEGRAISAGDKTMSSTHN